MNRAEAKNLSDLIMSESALRPQIDQIGNGEYVVIVQSFYLWSVDDWYKHRGNWRKSLFTLEVMR